MRCHTGRRPWKAWAVGHRSHCAGRGQVKGEAFWLESASPPPMHTHTLQPKGPVFQGGGVSSSDPEEKPPGTRGSEKQTETSVSELAGPGTLRLRRGGLRPDRPRDWRVTLGVPGGWCCPEARAVRSTLFWCHMEAPRPCPAWFPWQLLLTPHHLPRQLYLLSLCTPHPLGGHYLYLSG